MEAFYLYIPLIFLAISTISNYIFHKIHNLPPTPWLHPQLPIIGHLYLLKKPLHRSLAKLSTKHGPIQLFRFGSRRVLVVASPSLAEECLTTNDITFANRPHLLAGKYLGYNYTSLVFAPYGDHWRNLRRVSTVEILSSYRLREFVLGSIKWYQSYSDLSSGIRAIQIYQVVSEQEISEIVEDLKSCLESDACLTHASDDFSAREACVKQKSASCVERLSGAWETSFKSCQVIKIRKSESVSCHLEFIKSASEIVILRQLGQRVKTFLVRRVVSRHLVRRVGGVSSA
ncbi:hypothetical protein OSB04_005188 [Centaurea solstitialis]|uniref:Cytochrome P450 n=1 Tax=Centaurea solstitialis TaxID=347529 RepID=A0AA38TN50_9ASTR|nr:hypothetical protein OSB04_005188 [Centaurea solstitialis]